MIHVELMFIADEFELGHDPITAPIARLHIFVVDRFTYFFLNWIITIE